MAQQNIAYPRLLLDSCFKTVCGLHLTYLAGDINGGKAGYIAGNKAGKVNLQGLTSHKGNIHFSRSIKTHVIESFEANFISPLFRISIYFSS